MIFGLGIGSVVLSLGSWCLCAAIPSLGLGIATVILGMQDLKAMDAGLMDPSGREKTRSGQVMGFVSLAFSVILPLLALLYYFFSAFGR